MSVEKLPNGAGYKVRWRDTEGRSRRKTVRLYRDALTLDGEIKRKRVMGELVTHERGKERLCDFYEVWFERYAMAHLTPRTRGTYTHLARKHILPALGRVPLRGVTRESVDALSASLSASLSPSSVRQTLAILQGIMQRAVEWGYIAANPVSGARRPKLVTRRGRALTDEQVQALLRELTLRAATIVEVLASTGLRPGELRALRWLDIERAPARILVERAVSSNEIGPTKTNSRRTVDLRGEVARTLAEWFLACGHPMPDALVFPGAGGRVWTDQGWRMWQRQVFRPAAARAGLAGVVPYDLRHTFASKLIAEGHDIYWVARQLGHAPTVTLTTYAHLFKSVPSECPANAGQDRITRARPGI